ncbi:hypothetical protein LTS18_007813 [Coniosporium uncinatum]|uniref:Uncharacterized protein n=1 Tax=Coniosporium uncinatum TaxID=93489 RepID=A0ACC3E084_9PEZI|nr:hypothetical protein LTS18_007813 [Coniosporium uncinatum]
MADSDKVWSTTFTKAQTIGSKWTNFTNDYYDDDGWWALAWIRAYDVVGNKKYLAMADHIFNVLVSTAANATCGGIYWRQHAPQLNTAISNALFISTAAHLANRIPERKNYYLSWAKKNWEWFEKAGNIRSHWLVQDALNTEPGQNCKPQGGYYTYNQGVILGALIELNRAHPNKTYLKTANKIATAAINLLTDPQKIIHEGGENRTGQPDMGPDGATFKGVFMRNIGRLQAETGSEVYRDFIKRNADSIWANGRNQTTGGIGCNFAGPPLKCKGGINAATHQSGLDALVAAIVAKAGAESVVAPPATATATGTGTGTKATSTSVKMSVSQPSSPIVTSVKQFKSCPADNGTVVRADSGDEFVVECNVDHGGFDLPSTVKAKNPVMVSRLQDCIEACSDTVGCKAASLSAGYACYLKSGVGSARGSGHVHSARLVKEVAKRDAGEVDGDEGFEDEEDSDSFERRGVADGAQGDVQYYDDEEAPQDSAFDSVERRDISEGDEDDVEVEGDDELPQSNVFDDVERRDVAYDDSKDTTEERDESEAPQPNVFDNVEKRDVTDEEEAVEVRDDSEDPQPDAFDSDSDDLERRDISENDDDDYIDTTEYREESELPQLNVFDRRSPDDVADLDEMASEDSYFARRSEEQIGEVDDIESGGEYSPFTDREAKKRDEAYLKYMGDKRSKMPKPMKKVGGWKAWFGGRGDA